MDSSIVKKSPDELFTSDENDDVDKSFEFRNTSGKEKKHRKLSVIQSGRKKFGSVPINMENSREVKEEMIEDSNRSTEDVQPINISVNTNDTASSADTNESNQARNESVQNAKNLALKRKLSHSEDDYETKNDNFEKTDNADNMFVTGKLKRIKKIGTRNSVAHSKKYQLRKSSGINYVETESSDNTEGKESELNGDVKSKVGWTSNDQAKHNNRILTILNKGSLGDLKNLSRVGPKAAEMLLHFRRSHGPLNSLRDLERMPGWTARVFQLFMGSNGIVLD